MKAAVNTHYGSPEVVHLTEIDRPSPREDELLIKVRATTVTVGDSRMRSFTVPRGQWIPARLYLGLSGPRRQVLGMELAGDVEAVGSAVRQFKVGDAVFASTFANDFGGHAEYKCLPETALVATIPENLSYGEAAALPGAAATALRCLRRANIRPGQKVLIYGASGAVGTYAVQIACTFGAEVTGACSGANVELVKSLGASRVLDYTQDAFATHGERYDVVFDAVHKLDRDRARGLLAPGGIYLDVHTASGRGEAREEFLLVRELAAAGKIRPVIDRCYPFDQIVEAHCYVDQGHKRGSVVILVDPKEPGRETKEH